MKRTTPTDRQKAIHEAIKNYEEENGRYPELKLLGVYFTKPSRQNVHDFIKRMEKAKLVERFKTIEDGHKVIRIKAL